VRPLGGAGWASAGAADAPVSTYVSTKASEGDAKITSSRRASYTNGPP
jgi:hypothetical protein